MKKYVIFILLIATTIMTGCLQDDDDILFSYERVPIEEVDIPDEFTRGQTTEITVSYFRPTDCHSFSGFDYDRLSNERTVSVVNVFIEKASCQELQQADMIEQSFRFIVGSEDSYVFRFWQGRDDQGENQFLIVEVPVVE